MFLASLCFVYAVKTTTPANASFLGSLTPLVAVVFARFLGERLSKSTIVALVVATVALLSMGFIIASLVPTARFAQPIAGAILYPMLGLSGLFLPIEALPEEEVAAAPAAE